MTPDDAAKLTITLQVAEWNQILAVLADAPFRIVAPLINQITAQAQSVQGIAERNPMPLPNGSETVSLSD
jgi:hypothetical protein